MRGGSVALFVGCLLISACGQSRSPKTTAPAETVTEPAAPEADAEPPDPYAGVDKNADVSGMSEEERQAFLMKLGEKVYMTGDGGLACVTCHQKSGEGVPGAFPPLVGQAEWMGDCRHHATLVLEGLKGEIAVNGITYNGVMVPQRDLLNDLQIAAVISYVRQSWGNDYGFCSPQDVTAARTTD